MIKGTVKFFNKAKGFGFISPDDGSKDVYLPPTTVKAAGVERLKPGLRVEFESEPDTKGPKAVKLELLAEAPREAAPPPATQQAATLYYDSASDDIEEIQGALTDAGYLVRLVDYAVVPPTQDQLKRIALMLRDVDQSLVRRYDHLFLELQLDDRFISENDFWTAIVQHPSLINGPVVVAGHRARLCRTPEDVFLLVGRGESKPKPKVLTARMFELITGQPAANRPKAPEQAEPEEKDISRSAAKSEAKKADKPQAEKKIEKPKIEKPKTEKAKAKKTVTVPVAKSKKPAATKASAAPKKTALKKRKK